MPQNSKLNPNILLTETCNLLCAYCFAKEKMAKTRGKEMDICDFQRLLDFLKCNGQSEVRLMGGEPTLHSRFKEIVNKATVQGFKIRLFTNGHFSEDLAWWMTEKRQSMTYSINLSAIAFASEKNRVTAENNIKILEKNSKIYGSITVDNADLKKYDPLVALVGKNKFESVRISVANNTIDNLGSRSVADDYKNIIAVVINLADKLKKSGTLRFSLNCGFMPCMFTDNERSRFLEKGISLRGWGCSGKAGSFDVSADLSTFPCYIADDLRKAKLFDFKNLGLARNYNKDLFGYILRNSSLSTMSKCKECLFFKKKECKGPCLGYISNNRSEKKRIDIFKRSLRYKITEKLFRIFRNW